MPDLHYDIFDPAACGFAPPRVPFLPTLVRGTGIPTARNTFGIVGDGHPNSTFKRGRYALHEAFRLCGLGRGGALLAPAYHCRTMIDPAIVLGAPVHLYHLDERLRPDMAALEQLVGQARVPAKVLLLTHYFGIPQDAESVKSFCDAHGIALVEDCSHALLYHRGTKRIGTWGRYVTASPYKFFPCEEGGLLISSKGTQVPRSRRATLRSELKVLAHAAERAWLQLRRGISAQDVERLERDIEALANVAAPQGRQGHQIQNTPSRYYDEREQAQAAATTSGLIASLCNLDRMAALRRTHYQRWVNAVQGLPGCRALFEALPDDCVPYMFPLLIDDQQSSFHLLKRLGVPIWRWDDMATSDCPVSRRYRLRLLHLPCHQSLSDAEITWMIDAVTSAVRRFCGRG